MTEPTPRPAFPAYMQVLIDDLRAHNGQVTSGMYQGRTALILTTTGAKTGLPREVPLVYTWAGDGLAIMASKGGAPEHPAWYKNLVANPIVTVEAAGETFQARARVAEGAERDRLWDAHCAEYPGFLEYPKKTTRLIPAVVLERIR